MRVTATSGRYTTGSRNVGKPAVHRVLVVDDNDEWLEPIARLLRKAGHEVTTASTGDEALEVLHRTEVDVAIFDIGLPGMDGYILARRVRTELGAAAPRLIALTGYVDEDDRVRSARAGFAEHMTKPVDVEALLTAVGTSGRAPHSPSA